MATLGRICSGWHEKTVAHIIITRKFRQGLGDISLEDIQKEGYNSLEEFKRSWIDINGFRDPDAVVIVYEFTRIP